MIVMGVDQSTNKIGIGIMDNGKLLHHEEINLKQIIKNDDRFLNKEYIDRICLFKEILLNRVKVWNVQAVAFEDPIVNSKNVSRSKNGNKNIEIYGKLKEALGVYKVALIELDMLYETYLPPEWRKGKKLGTERNDMKKNAIEYVNKKYGLNLLWIAPNKSKNQDDIAEGIMICEFLDKKLNK